jgi:hypothetical protein
MNRPLLLIDIDGVISLFGFDHGLPPPGRFVSVDGIVHFLSEQAAEQLIVLGQDFDLAWCSGWEEKADEYLPFLLGLPRGLPHLCFERGAVPGESLHGHWKLAAIDAYAEVRPLAWIDDCLDTACHSWASARPAPTLLVQTKPDTGITTEDAQTLAQWALEGCACDVRPQTPRPLSA